MSDLPLLRVPMPAAYQGWGSAYDRVTRPWRSQMGMEPRWSWGAVQAFRVIAAANTAIELPSDPYLRNDESASPGQRRFSKEITYWTALHALLTCRLGWDHPGLGLQRAAVLPEIQDDTYDLVRQLWLADGHIDTYLDCSASRSRLDRHTSNDPFHFDDHVSHAWGSDNQTNIVTSFLRDEERRRATLVFEIGSGWCAALHRLGSNLPEDGVNSWHVDVFVKPIGFMGTYRKSRVTGRWFTGKHSLHMLGQDG